jgi:hypothetical protein
VLEFGNERSALVPRISTLVAVTSALCLFGCIRPLTNDECLLQSPASTRLDCLDKKIAGDTMKNALVGGIIGAAAGAGIGFAIGGPQMAGKVLLYSAAGGVGGAVIGGAATYYVEHREADALQDVIARNATLAEYVRYYQLEASRSANDRRDMKALLDRLNVMIPTLQIQRDIFNGAAINRYGPGLTPPLQQQLKINTENIDTLLEIKKGIIDRGLLD